MLARLANLQLEWNMSADRLTVSTTEHHQSSVLWAVDVDEVLSRTALGEGLSVNR